MNKTAVIIGATGLVGGHLLNMLLECGDYKEVWVLGRTSTQKKHPKLQERLGDPTNAEFWDWQYAVDDLYCAVGTTRSKTSDLTVYKQIDMGIPHHAAQWGLKNGMHSFAVVSAMGANASSKIFYNHIKGQMEDSLLKMAIPHLLIFRPSLIMGKREELRVGETIGKVLAKTFSFLIPDRYKGIEAETIARAMLKKGNSQGEGKYILESDDIRRVAEQ